MAATDALTRAGLNLIQQALSIFDSDLRLVLANAPMQHMFDLPDSVLAPGTHFRDVIRYLAKRGEYGDVGDLDSFVAARVDLARTFEPHYMERTRANGRTIAVEGAPLPQGGWVTVYTDITATKAQEELLRTRSEVLSEEVLRRSEALAASNRKLAATNAALEEARRELTQIEARTRHVTEMMPAHIAHVDAAGVYTFSNKRLRDVLPGRRSDIVGLHISDALGASAFERVEASLGQAFAGHQTTLEFTDMTSSRRIRTVFTPDPQTQGVYILSMDITEETQARVALQQTRRREMAAQLTSGLAHDFSNLLTIILGMQSKLERMIPQPEARPLIRATQQAAERGGTLLHRIADMTSARSYMPQPVAVAPFLADVALLAGPALPDSTQLITETSLEGSVLLDPGMVQDALLNLILNARDACGPSGGTITLSIHAVQGTWIEFVVADSGPGFSSDALRHGLDPFFTTKGAKGSGLGLSMVYDMTKLAGGETRLANRAGGAEVTLRLPLRVAPPQTDPHLVLLVEDDPDLRSTVRDMLMDLGHTVIEAGSATEAAHLARQVPGIALILSDVMLGDGKTGLDLQHDLPDLPVVLMTSLPVETPLHQQALTRAPVLSKPFTAAQLAGALALIRRD